MDTTGWSHTVWFTLIRFRSVSSCLPIVCTLGLASFAASPSLYSFVGSMPTPGVIKARPCASTDESRAERWASLIKAQGWCSHLHVAKDGLLQPRSIDGHKESRVGAEGRPNALHAAKRCGGSDERLAGRLFGREGVRRLRRADIVAAQPVPRTPEGCVCKLARVGVPEGVDGGKSGR